MESTYHSQLQLHKYYTGDIQLPSSAIEQEHNRFKHGQTWSDMITEGELRQFSHFLTASKINGLKKSVPHSSISGLIYAH
jgi:hypothetical protein